jgi:hypothetical protein
MASILIRRDQFNITPQGIVHKPTDSHFAPHAGDPYTGNIHLGQVGNVVPGGERYDSVQLKRVMMQIWTEYVTANPNLFPSRVHGQAHQGIPCASDGPARWGSSVGADGRDRAGHAAARDPSD